MMGTMDLGSFDFMTIFDFVLLIYGAYSVYASRKMKSNGQPPQWLMSVEEIQRIRKPQEFCDYMGPKTLLFGLLCVVYGIYGILTTMFLKNQILEAVGVAAFVVCIIWFVVTLRKAKQTYI